MIPLERLEVEGVPMAYREVGEGDPIVLLHGNPTSSFLWRGVLPRLAPLGRCIAPDLVGMGASAKLPSSGPGVYRYADHRRYVDGLLDLLGVHDRVVLVGHDWGGVLLTDWARRHEGALQGIAFMETLVAPVSWDGPNAPEPSVFGPLRSGEGERLVLEENLFVEAVLPAGTARALTDEEMEAYRAPFLEPGEGWRPTLTWAREIPIDGEPADVHDAVAANAAFMASTPTSKLFIDGDPGALLTGPLRDLVRSWPSVTEVTVPGLHFLPEDAPEEVAAALAGWISSLRPTTS